MQDLNDLYYFLQVVDHGGFAPAGRALGMPKSRLSRRLTLLEERLGVRLIHRSTRRFVVTEVGRRYYEHCRAMLAAAEAAQEAVDSVRGEPRGVIRMTCPITLLHAHVGNMLGDFLASCPQVELHLEATNRRVDLLAEGVDIAIRVRPAPLEDSDLVLRTLSDRGQALVAAPGLLEDLGSPATPAALADLPTLWVGWPEERHQWVLHGPAGETETVALRPRYITTDMMALREAALAGVGVVQLPRLLVREQFADGSLVDVLPGWAPRREIIHAVFPSRRGVLPAVRALIEHLAEAYACFDED